MHHDVTFPNAEKKSVQNSKTIPIKEAIECQTKWRPHLDKIVLGGKGTQKESTSNKASASIG